jgi:hypothetical protein
VATSTQIPSPATLPITASYLTATSAPSQNLLAYWHLLSLDAPTVAMLWTWFIARSCGIHLPPTAVLAMGTAVWLLYAADRLLDSRNLLRSSIKSFILSEANISAQSEANNSSKSLEPRHHFHRHHQRRFRFGILAAAFALATLIPQLAAPSIRLYALLGTVLTVYFGLIHLQRNPAPRLPKEIAVGIFFSAATFIPTVARQPTLRAQLLPAAIFFGLTCSLNCLFIYAWEHPSPFPEAHATTRLALRHLRPLIGLAVLGSFTLTLRLTRWQLPCAVAIAASFLLLLHCNRRHLSATTLRASADLCLLTPILFTLTLPS